MKKYLLNFTLLLTICVLTSCRGGSKGFLSPTSSGRSYEILVVVGNDTWESPAGRALYNVLNSSIPGLPQSEAHFRIMQTPMSGFDSTLKLVRNIIIVDIQDIYTKVSLKYAKNTYANPQMIMTIQAPNAREFEEYVETHGKQIIDFFTKAEMNRQIRILENKHNDYISNKVKEEFGSDIWLPGELASFKEGEDFFWASTNTATGNLNFVIYSYPFTDNNTFTKDFFIQKRDSVMKINLPGAMPGSYMATDTLFTEVTPINVQGDYALEARGLWKMNGDFMGGPYVSHTRLDKENNRIITAEVFVYSPDKKKGNLMRGLEPSLYTLRLPEKLKQTDDTEVVIIEEEQQ